MKRAQYVDESDEEPEQYSSGSEAPDEEAFGELAKKRGYEEDDLDLSDSDSDGPPEETGNKRPTTSGNSGNSGNSGKKKRAKHAPAEASSKRRVSVIRDIPGLKTKTQSMYRDVRFDPIYGKADINKTRKDYAFLDEYRQSELNDMRKQMKKTKNQAEKDELQKDIKSMQSRLDTMKNRDFEHRVISDKKREMKQNNQNPYYLKESDKKKLVLEAKYKEMKRKDVEKALSRKRKKNAAKERKAMPEVRRGA